MLIRDTHAYLIGVAAVCLLMGTRAIWPEDEESPENLEFNQVVEKFESERGLEAFERLQTIVDFGPLLSSKVVPFLVNVFEEEDNPSIAAAVVRALGLQANEPAIKFVVQQGIPRLLGDFANFPAVGEALQHRFDAKIEKWLLKNLLTDNVRRDADALAMALKVIAELEDRSRFKVLEKALKGTSDSDMKVAILNVFRDYRPKVATKVATKHLKKSVKRVQIAALEVLHATKYKSKKSTYIKLLKSPHSKVRILAIDLLALSGNKTLVKHVSPLLKHKDWTARIAAVHALARTASKEAVLELIQALDGSGGRVKDDIIDVLMRLTGEDIGSTGLQWESWWQVNKDTTELRWRSPREFEIVRTKNKNKSKKTVTYYGLRVLSDKITFVIDFSNSMGESYVGDTDPQTPDDPQKNSMRPVDEEEEKDKKKKKKEAGQNDTHPSGPTKISVAKDELLSVIESLRDNVLVNVIGFETFVSPWRPEMQKLSSETRPEIEKFINKGQPNGMTNVYGSIEAAFKDSRVDTIYFLSDGAPTHGRYIKSEDILRGISNLNRYRKVRINTIGFKLKPEEEKLMRNLADENYGIFIRK